MIITDGLAFPRPGSEDEGMPCTHSEGMTLREWYAGLFAAALATDSGYGVMWAKLAADAVEGADALLAELAKRESEVTA